MTIIRFRTIILIACVRAKEGKLMKQSDYLAEFDRLYKEIDKIYHTYAKDSGFSDAHLWLLYSLYENGNSLFTQREICSAWHYPPQTVNSALKALEKQELVTLEAVSGNRKNKAVVLTAKGRETAERVILPLMRAEKRAFRGMSCSERDALISLTSKYVSLLRGEVSKA